MLSDRPSLRKGRELPSGCHCCSSSVMNCAPVTSTVIIVLAKGLIDAASA